MSAVGSLLTVFFSIHFSMAPHCNWSTGTWTAVATNGYRLNDSLMVKQVSVLRDLYGLVYCFCAADGYGRIKTFTGDREFDSDIPVANP